MGRCVGVCVCVCVRACVRVCVRVFVYRRYLCKERAMTRDVVVGKPLVTYWAKYVVAPLASACQRERERERE